MSTSRRGTLGAVVLVVVAALVGLVLSRDGGTAEPAAAPSVSARAPIPSPTSSRTPASGLSTVDAADLPSQARRTLALIDAGGPFPYAKDGSTFGNVERRLPPRPGGWYREYTVPTPGESDRGPRRIVTGGPARGSTEREVFYTADHYGTFVAVRR